MELKKTIKKHSLPWIPPVLLTIIVLILHFFMRFDFSKEVNVADLVNLAILVWISFYIPIHLDKWISVNKSEKDLVLNVCDKLETKLEELLLYIEPMYAPDADYILSQEESIRIKNKIRALGNILDVIASSTEFCFPDIKINENVEELIELHTDFYDQLTFGLGSSPKISALGYINAQNIAQKYQDQIMALKLALNRL